MTSTVTDKVRKIKASMNFGKMSDSDLLKRLDAVHVGLTDNAAFPNPPVAMTDFRSGIDLYHTLTTDALDGGKKAVSAKRKQREAVINMATHLGHYVEAVCDNDLASFNTSGFTAVSNTRTPPEPLPPASIQWIDRGPTSGTLLVKVASIRGALIYEVRFGLGDVPTDWKSVTLTSPKTATIENLTPGATYALQVRALGKVGYTDWSDSTTFICA